MSNIVALKDDAAKRHYNAYVNPVDRFPHIREYAPGGRKHLTDSRVAALNEALLNLSNKIGGNQVLFAAWHDKNQMFEQALLYGVIIWAKDKEIHDKYICLGNAESDASKDKPFRIGSSDTNVIVPFYYQHFLAQSAARDNNMTKAKELDPMMQERAAKHAEAKKAFEEGKQAILEAAKSEIYKDKPIREDSPRSRRLDIAVQPAKIDMDIPRPAVVEEPHEAPTVEVVGNVVVTDKRKRGRKKK